ncbi:unnamed protein product [Mesocestoides corti]|uniref:C2H2-type domain-containing protein n=1 Tax=Mesocestoides corti TaxID=53468 RepID=A0A0R3UJN3_MESCO|nr:unnamed protein product [Mesocestoides corti]
MLQLQHKQQILIAPRPTVSPLTSASSLSKEINQLKMTQHEVEEEEDLVIVEPTDPDEDRMREAALQAQQEVTLVQATSPPKSTAEVDASKSGFTNSPVLFSQILQALSAKSNKQATENPQQAPRFLVASSNNVLTIQTPVKTTAGAVQTQASSFMVQPLSGVEAAKLLNLSTAPQLNSTPTPLVTASPPVQNPGIQSLLTTNPLLSGVLVNCATANLVSQLSSSVSASMFSFAQTVAMDKAANVDGQIAEITQMLSVLINLASSLSNSLPGLANLKPPGNTTTNSTVPQTNPILTSLIAPPQPVVNLASNPTMVSFADLKSVTSTNAPPPPNVVCPQPCPPIQLKPEPTVSSTAPPASSSVPAANGTLAAPVAGLRTKSGAVLASVKSSGRAKPFICPHSGCTRAFSSRFNLVEHIRIHTGERPFVCPEPGCKSRFKRRRDLYEHATTHKARLNSEAARRGPLLTALLTSKDKQGGSSGDHLGHKRRRHFCPFPNCPRSYARRHRLNQHMCAHTGMGPYYCDQPNCSVRYFCAGDLERHKLVHLVPTSGDPVKKHLCPSPDCGKAYSKLNKLREHVRSHTGERPYVCDREGCNASFIRLYGLKRHQLTHLVALREAMSDPPKPAEPSNPQPPSTSAPSPATCLVTTIPVTSTLTAIFPPSATLIPRVGLNSQPTILNFVQALTNSGVQLKPIVAAQPKEESLPAPSNLVIKPDPDSTPVSTASIVTTAPSVTITSIASTATSKLPLVQRSIKAAATPSASALAEKAIVVSGPFGKRRHICPMPGCTKIFPKLNKLREHICRHTGERPYACEECPATFVRMYDLRRHAMIHTRKKTGILNNGV